MAATKNGTHVPRASIGIQLLDDPEYLHLTEHEDGGWGGFLFVCLIAAAKKMRNKGVFKPGKSDAVKLVARAIKWDVENVSKGLNAITESCDQAGVKPWVFVDSEGSLVIRSYEKWNHLDKRGGDRRSASFRATKNGGGSPVERIKPRPKERPKPINDASSSYSLSYSSSKEGEVSEVPRETPRARASKPPARTLTSPHLSQAEDFRTAAAALDALEHAAAADDPRASPLRPDQRQEPLAALKRLGWTPEYLRTELIPAIRASEQSYMVNPAKLFLNGERAAADFERRLMGVPFAERDAETDAALRRLKATMGGGA